MIVSSNIPQSINISQCIIPHSLALIMPIPTEVVGSLPRPQCMSCCLLSQSQLPSIDAMKTPSPSKSLCRLRRRDHLPGGTRCCSRQSSRRLCTEDGGDRRNTLNRRRTTRFLVRHISHHRYAGWERVGE